MKSKLITPLLFSAILLTGYGCGASTTSVVSEKEIIAEVKSVNERRYRALLDADTAALAQIYADDYKIGRAHV